MPLTTFTDTNFQTGGNEKKTFGLNNTFLLVKVICNRLMPTIVHVAVMH